VTKKNDFLLIIIALTLFSVISPLSCGGKPGDFGIYLADTGENVLSGQDIKAYHSSDSSFELNETGIEKWNSFNPYMTAPQLSGTLFKREFIIKIEDREVCRGQFWSGVSSASYSGVVILDALFKLDSTHNKLRIMSGYPVSEGFFETGISSEISGYFKKHNKLAE
jgi:hypothetical protein